MSKHDHPEACQHTVALCDHCGTVYCTQCEIQWEQVPLPGVMAQAAMVPGSPAEAQARTLLAAAPHAHQEDPDG